MLLEHFDKCSDLKKFTDKTVTHDDLEGVSSEDIDKCSQLEEVINDRNNYLHLYNNDDSNKLENPINNLNFDNFDIKQINIEALKSKQIYI